MSLTAKVGGTVLPGDIKRTNRRNVLQVLRRGEAVSAAEICERTGLSHPTAMKALQEFCDAGIVRSQGYGSATSRGGKKPEMFVFCDFREVLCISLWPEMMAFSHCRLTEEVRDLECFPIDRGIGLDEAIDVLKEQLTGYLNKHNIKRDGVYGVAINMPGTVDYDRKLLNFNVKAPQWGKHIPIADKLKEMFPEETVFYMDNAGKAVGRALLGDHNDYSDKRLLTIFCTWGISACMIDKGHVLNGRDALIGEIGHMIISDSSIETCVCGKRGCLESLVNMKRIRALLKERGADPSPALSFKELFERSAAGEADYHAMSTYLAHYYAMILHNLSLTYNQDIVVFQGDLAWADDVFDRALRRELSEFAYYPEDRTITIEYDRRDLPLLAARGDADCLKNFYFQPLDR